MPGAKLDVEVESFLKVDVEVELVRRAVPCLLGIGSPRAACTCLRASDTFLRADCFATWSRTRANQCKERLIVYERAMVCISPRVCCHNIGIHGNQSYRYPWFAVIIPCKATVCSCERCSAQSPGRLPWTCAARPHRAFARCREGHPHHRAPAATTQVAEARRESSALPGSQHVRGGNHHIIL